MADVEEVKEVTEFEAKSEEKESLKEDKTNTIVDVTNDGGVIKEIIKNGEGSSKPKIGDEVTVHYVGMLTSGEKFDSSRDRNVPFKFKLGAGAVIKGWEKVIETMHKGEIAKVTLKPDYGYGKGGAPPKIPPNSTLLFEIELISWDNEKDLTKDRDGGVLKKIIKEGDHWELPNFESVCKLTISTTDTNGKIYENEQLKEIRIGDEELTIGLEKAIESMKKGERAKFTVKAKYGYGTQGNPNLGIPPDTDLIYDIEMIDFVKGKESWQFEKFIDKCEHARRRKNEGNTHFENQKYQLAIKKYDKAIDLLKYDSSFSSDEKKMSNEVKLAAFLNLSAAFYKIGDVKQSLDNSKKALEIDSKNIKGLWRRGIALTQMGDWVAAKNDFDTALSIDPDNKAVKTSYQALKKRMEVADKKDKLRYVNLFERLSLEENKSDQ